MNLNYIMRVWTSPESGSFYVEGASVIESKVKEFHPLSLKKMRDLGSAMTGNSIAIGGFIPKEIIYLSLAGGSICLAWITEEKNATLLFKPDTTIKSGKYAIPRLLWLYRRSELHLYAVKDIEDPITNTKLYKAPFLNMFQSDKVCFGNVSNKSLIDEEVFVNMMQKIEDMFFNSFFSHVSAENLEGGLVNYYNSKQKEFPYDKLINAGKTIGSILSPRDFESNS